MHNRRKRKIQFHHALITVFAVILLVFLGIVFFDCGPQISLVFACLFAGMMALWLGYSWDEILEGMIGGINGSLEAILILLLIGMLEGAWIAAGTVPSIICFGLEIVTVRTFLPAAMIVCCLIGLMIGSWGTIGTVGLAFMGIGLSLQFPAPLVAGAIISGAYLGEALSPLSEVPNLAAVVTGKKVSLLVKKAAVPLTVTGILSVLIYTVSGLRFGGVEAQELSAGIKPLVESLKHQFVIHPAAILPLLLVVIFVLRKMPAIPALLLGTVAGMIQAVLLQGESVHSILTVIWSGYSGSGSSGVIRDLLSAGGMQSMLETVSVVLVAMAFGGIMRKTGQMDALVHPLLLRIRTDGGLNAAAVLTCAAVNVILPDQYLGVSMPGQMYIEEYDRRGISREQLGAALIGSGAVTSPLVPWNTCGMYCMAVLSVSPVSYLRYAYIGLLLPVMMILTGFFLWQQEEKPAAHHSAFP